MRLFVALELPEGFRGKMERIQNTLRPLSPEVRWVRPENFHLTLKFLGEMDAAGLEDLQAVLERVAERHRVFEVDLQGVGAFPNLRRPRVLWVGVLGDLSPLKSMARQLNRELEALGVPPEAKPFSGHLTLGRIKRPAPNPALEKELATFSESRVGRLRVEEVCLFQSQLKRGGPEYTCLSRHGLHDEAA